MKFHTKMSCALGLLIGLGAQSQAEPEKPLDIMKFMREQAASTRAAEPRKPRATAKAQHPAPHRAVAAKDTAKNTAKPKSDPAPAPMLPEAATASAPPAPAASPFPPAPRAETVGSAVSTG